MLSRYTLIFVLSLFAADAAKAFDLSEDPPPAPSSRLAQSYNVPPSDIYDGADSKAASDPEATLRMDRLERELRRLTGQNEELQHKVQLLEDQLRAAKSDPRAEAAPHGSTTPPPAAQLRAFPTAPPGAGKRSDAFDPAAQPFGARRAEAAGNDRPVGARSR
ncbi:MAG: hypothetical protein U1E25_05915 [Methylocystis sp.]